MSDQVKPERECPRCGTPVVVDVDVARVYAEVAQLRKLNKELVAKEKAATKLAKDREREVKNIMNRLWARGEGPDGKPVPEGTPAP